LDEVAEHSLALLRVDACTISVLEDAELVVKAAAGGARDLVETRYPLGAHPAAEVVDAGAPVAFADATPIDRVGRSDPVLAAGYDAYVAVPLHRPDGEVYAVLTVYAREPRVWRPDEIDALGALAASASAAIANAELYQHVAVERERSLTILGNVADGIV